MSPASFLSEFCSYLVQAKYDLRAANIEANDPTRHNRLGTHFIRPRQTKAAVGPFLRFVADDLYILRERSRGLGGRANGDQYCRWVGFVDYRSFGSQRISKQAAEQQNGAPIHSWVNNDEPPGGPDVGGSWPIYRLPAHQVPASPNSVGNQAALDDGTVFINLYRNVTNEQSLADGSQLGRTWVRCRSDRYACVR